MFPNWKLSTKSTLYKIDKEYIKKRLSLREIPALHSICIDEISYKKRHKYFTVISDQENSSVVWVSEGRAKDSLSSFFKELGREKCKQIQFVTMDMWKPYRLSIKEHLPNAKIICDRFHLIKLLNIYVDKVRKNEQQNARLKNREIINNKRWILLKSEKNLNDKQLRSLKKLLSLNKNLAKCHILKEEFLRLFSLNSEHEAKIFILNWINKAYQTCLKPLTSFANTLLKWFESILNYFSNKITNSIAEGINNKIKTVKKIAYGYKDKDYFILKIYQYCGNLPKIA